MSAKDKILEDLFTDNSNDEILFEQYKLYVEMANDVSERRDKTNKFYVTLMSLLLTVFSIISSITNNWIIFIIPLTIMILISIVWMKNIKSYATLNQGKFDVINEIEKKLPSKGFTIEWELMKVYDYKNLTKIEKNIPLTILILSMVAIIWILSPILIQKVFCFF